jgi:nickel/cobalt transporter (NicO) family protein
MIDNGILLYATAASVGFVHTVLGPDHYVPFVAMARAGEWSRRKTVVITLLCGLGHVLSSAVLGLIGIAFGVAVFKLEWIERFRGDLAGWLLIAFGLVYFLWGVRRAVRNQPHSHFHAHADGMIHTHEHMHHADHVHVHDASEPAGSEPRLQRSGQSEPGAQATSQDRSLTVAALNDAAVTHQRARQPSLTPWVLFTIFIFGPCEPLIPILMYAAAKGTAWTVIGVTLVFSVITIATMLTVVLSSSWAIGIAPLHRWQRFGHALAGLVVLACGVAVQTGL